jgi:hypothetical protein
MEVIIMKNYLEILYIEKLLKNNPLSIRKKEKIYARLPLKEELGTELINYKIDKQGRFEIEDKTFIEKDLVLARHENPIGEINEIPMYKEWLIPLEVWLENYNKKPSYEFKAYDQKKFKAIKITDKILDLLGSKNGKNVFVSTLWSAKGQKVFKNGMLTAEGFVINPKDLVNLYEECK